MRTFLFLAMALAASVVGAQNKLTVTVDGIENPKGTVLVAIFDSINFLKQPVYYGMVNIEEGQEEVTIVIEDVAPGKYALTIFQDENGNNRLDTGAYGKPIEKYGFSNNAVGEMGPPTFQDCMISVEEDTEVNVTVM
ncbi:MAG: DUF2141 domain-containing protein [Tannerella sp.]|jgi:uncharacterized protein (DUF2141 family)|nr:DUF2141 domain-containing protein [Tannerella sp.]